MNTSEIKAAYLLENPDAENAVFSVWSFGGNTSEMPNQLAELVKNRQKTVTSSAYFWYKTEREPVPQVGAYSIILNANEEAVCIIQTIKVTVVPFAEVSEAHAYKEGEFDRSLSAWRKCHTEVFTKKLAEFGQQFTEDMPVVCEEFCTVYPMQV